MAVLENQRHEIFAQELAKGETTSKAYETAGFQPNRANAARLKANERIGERVRELQANAARSTEVSIQSVLLELQDAIDVARSKGQAQAMVSASSMKAKLAGLLVERSQVEITGPDRDEPKNIEELCRQIADEKLDGLTNARWLPITNADRQQLADIVGHWLAEMQAFVDQVNARPLVSTQRIEPPLLANGKGGK